MAEVTNDPHGHGHAPHNPEISHERKDINIFQVTSFGIGLALGCIVIAFAMWAMFDFLRAREDAKNPARPSAMMQEKQKLPPEPRLQAQPKLELKDLRESEDAILNNFGWLNPDKGIVRIPVSLAIDMVAKKGLPSNPSPAGANGGYRMIPLSANGGRTMEKISQ